MHGGDVGHPDQATLVREERRLEDVLGRGRAMPDRQGAEQAPGLHRARLAHVFQLVDALPHDAGLEAQGLHLVLVQGDLDHAIPTAAHVDVRHAVHLEQLRHELLIHVGAQRLEGIRTGDRVAQEGPLLLAELPRHVGLQRRRRDTGRQFLLEGRQPLRELEPGEVHVRVPRELHRHRGPGHALLLVGSRLDPLDAPDLLHRRLELRGHERLHRLGRGVAPPGLDGELRELRIRQQLDGDVAPRGDPQEGHGQVGHAHGDRSPDAELDHRSVLASTREFVMGPLAA